MRVVNGCETTTFGMIVIRARGPAAKESAASACALISPPPLRLATARGAEDQTNSPARYTAPVTRSCPKV